MNLHNGITLNNEFLNAVKENLDWRLIDPKTKEAVKIINARDLWWQIIYARAETGEPYIVNLDLCNENLPKGQKDLGLEIPDPPSAVANYVPFKIADNLVYISGQAPSKNGKIIYTGKVGEKITDKEGVLAAELCCLNIIAGKKFML